jgi:hypothetical protein
MAKPLISPVITPIRLREGGSGSAAAESAGGGVETTGAGIGAVGLRRDGLKSGRSKVVFNVLNGIPQRGLPLCNGSCPKRS